MKKLKLVLLWLGIFGFWTVNQASQAQTPIKRESRRYTKPSYTRCSSQ